MTTRASLRGLLTPESGLLGQGVRYALTGCIVSVVYLSITTTLALVAGVPFQVALPIGFGAGLAVNFTLQRVFVWGHREPFALPFHRQAGGYIAVAGTQYAVTAASTSLLPARLGLPTAVVYLATALLLTSLNFLIFRQRVFHPRAAELDASQVSADPLRETRAPIARRADGERFAKPVERDFPDPGRIEPSSP